MRVEWDTYQSPIGPLTIVESADGPLVVEFPPRTPRIQWAVRTRGTLPELRVEAGPCDATRRWLDGYGWRPLTEVERVATAVYYRELGRHMGIKDIP